jgi:hypothetical protein
MPVSYVDLPSGLGVDIKKHSYHDGSRNVEAAMHSEKGQPG